MATASGDRSAHFPKIEAKHGKPVAFYMQELADLGDAKYPDQIALLRERYGFSQAHANAVVMTFRGSPSSKRFTTVEQYLKSLPVDQRTTASAIIAAISKRYPTFEWVIAWNQPMLRTNGNYVFGISAAKHHLLVAPWGKAALQELAPKLTEYKVNKKTIQVPNDWKVNATLLHDLVAARLAELETV